MSFSAKNLACKLLFLTNFLLFPANAIAAEKTAGGLNIVAVVGEQAITSFDVDARIKFIIATTKISNSPEVLKNIRPQVIRALIDESLQRQKAKDSDIKVEDEEVAKAIASIEAQRGMQLGAISAMLSANKVPEKTFKDQVRAQLSWNKWLSKNVLPFIKVSNEEIDLAKTKIVEQPDVNEMEIAIIALPVDKKKSELSVKKTADNLVQELKKGARFEELARQFSNSDGKSFWIRPEQLEPNIAKFLIGKKEGEITSPIRTADGFSIIKVFALKQSLPDKEATDAQPKIDEAKVKESLIHQKFELEAQKNMRNLRRDAFIEIRE